MKTIFLIAPYFPPSSLPPSQRARLMVNHLKELGYHPVVFTTHHKYREEREDPWMNELLTGEHEKITIRSFDQRFTRKFKLGDLSLRWIPFLFFALIRARKKKPQFVIYLVPPWYLLLIAPVVKWILRTPYAIDFIDPWVSSERKLKNMKQRISHWIARTAEGWVTRSADYIYAVSKPINQDLVKRHPRLANKVFNAVPYGVEVSDYKKITVEKPVRNEVTTIRYIGAVWSASYPVLEVLLKAFGEIRTESTFKVEFIGTSYFGIGLAQPQLESFIKKFDLSDLLTEDPNRRPYREAIILNMQADIMLLFGDMSKQYAASKLMGLIASGKPFLAFLHRETHPYRYLEDHGYPYLVGYSDQPGDKPESHLSVLKDKLLEILDNYSNFKPIDQSDVSFQKHTAAGMTKQIMEPIEKLIK